MSLLWVSNVLLRMKKRSKTVIQRFFSLYASVMEEGPFDDLTKFQTKWSCLVCMALVYILVITGSGGGIGFN